MLNSSVRDKKLCPLLMKFVLNYSHCCRFLADLEKLIAYKEEAQRWHWNRYVTEVALEIFRSREEEYHTLLPLLSMNNFRSREEEGHPLPMPENLRDGRDRIAFGNIMRIAEFHRDIFTQVLFSIKRRSRNDVSYWLSQGVHHCETVTKKYTFSVGPLA